MNNTPTFSETLAGVALHVPTALNIVWASVSAGAQEKVLADALRCLCEHPSEDAHSELEYRRLCRKCDTGASALVCLMRDAPERLMCVLGLDSRQLDGDLSDSMFGVLVKSGMFHAIDEACTIIDTCAVMHDDVRNSASEILMLCMGENVDIDMLAALLSYEWLAHGLNFGWIRNSPLERWVDCTFEDNPGTCILGVTCMVDAGLDTRTQRYLGHRKSGAVAAQDVYRDRHVSDDRFSEKFCASLVNALRSR